MTSRVSLLCPTAVLHQLRDVNLALASDLLLADAVVLDNCKLVFRWPSNY
jgi:hypothetical protein